MDNTFENPSIKINIKINNQDLSLEPILKKYKNVAGIYIIINKINNKFYIGSSVEVYKRIQHHKNSLKRGEHSNCHLQNAWYKYGEINFIAYLIEIIAKNDENYENNLRFKEEYWIKLLNANIYGYNLAIDTIRPLLGKKLSDETKHKLSVLKLGENNPMYGKSVSKKQMEQMKLVGKSMSKPIFQLDFNNMVINKWNSIKEASLELNIDSSGISQCCNKNIKTYKNFVWRFENDYDTTEVFDLSRDNIKYKNIHQYDLQGNLIKIWDNTMDICKTLNYRDSSIMRCLRGERKKYKGFIWCI